MLKRRFTWIGIATLSLAISVSEAHALDFVHLPISSITSGASNPAVSQSNVKATICSKNWLSKNQPNRNFLSQSKILELKTSYSQSYKAFKDSQIVEDLLIPVNLGGSINSISNLWPLPKVGEFGSDTKRLLEDKLNSLVCTGKVSLSDAQIAISSNWYSALQKYVLKVPVTDSVKLLAPVLSYSNDPSLDQWNFKGQQSQINVGRLLWKFQISLDGRPWKTAYIGSKDHVEFKFQKSAVTQVIYVRAAVANEYGTSLFSAPSKASIVHPTN